MDLRLDGKVAVVTGAAGRRGLGRAIALALAKENADVAVIDIDFEGVEAVAHEIKGMGRKSIAIKADQGVHEGVKKAISQINDEFGKIDILVNNAAVTSNFDSVRKMEPSKWAWEININLNGPWFWTREVLPIMFQNKWGRIVNISSIAGITGAIGLPAYAASKGGLVALTKATAREGAARGVTANVAILGMVNTEVYQRAELDPKVVEGMVKRTLLGRMAEPNEVADIIVFLCSERAYYITGAEILIDGGMIINV